jgi:hypothetical protein
MGQGAARLMIRTMTVVATPSAQVGAPSWMSSAETASRRQAKTVQTDDAR